MLKFDLSAFKNDLLYGSITFKFKVFNFDPQETLMDRGFSFDDNQSMISSNMCNLESAEEAGSRINEKKLCLKILMLNDNILPHAKYTEGIETYKLKIPDEEEDSIIQILLDLFYQEFYKIHRDELLEKTKMYLNDRETQTNLLDPKLTSDLELWAINRSLFQQIVDLESY